MCPFYRYWSDVNPHFNVDVTSAHPQKVMVWAGIIGTHLIGPYFFDAYVNGQNYLDMLQEFVLPELQNIGINPANVIFQHDGAGPHRDLNVIQFILETFEGLIGSGGFLEWPARSPDITMLDFSLWGTLKDKMFPNLYESLEELRNRIEEAFEEITPQMLENTQRRAIQRFQKCIDVEGLEVTR